jgi:hypothetical protein
MAAAVSVGRDAIALLQWPSAGSPFVVTPDHLWLSPNSRGHLVPPPYLVLVWTGSAGPKQKSDRIPPRNRDCSRNPP